MKTTTVYGEHTQIKIYIKGWGDGSVFKVIHKHEKMNFVSGNHMKPDV